MAFSPARAAVFSPPYFVAIAAPVFLEASKVASDPAAQARDSASNVYALAISLALFIAAILAPIIGTYADITGQRKRQLIIVTIIAGILSSAMFVITTGTWLVGIVLYMAAQVALNIALGLNSSLLPHVARPDDMNRASSLGYAMGYIGGAVLLPVNTAPYPFSGKLRL